MWFLPWWAGALALGTICVGYFWLTRQTMGVSGSLYRALDWRVSRAGDRDREAFEADPAAVEAALLEATRAEFGDDAAPPPVSPPPAAAPPPPSLSLGVHVTFLGAIFAGSLATAWLRGALHVHRDLGDEFGRLVAHGGRAWLVLAAGGVLVGFGTRLAGGCTSGHGLSGCGRLQPGSLVATAIFFGCAVAISLALGALA
ncbi:MAG TPA: YeeE/YedE thiosulfate transporter family protein [Polyangia bacterium]|nr:YeeE/YedE thiosulfate transporter family protein [Polyangia bacterium]